MELQELWIGLTYDVNTKGFEFSKIVDGLFAIVRFDLEWFAAEFESISMSRNLRCEHRYHGGNTREPDECLRISFHWGNSDRFDWRNARRPRFEWIRMSWVISMLPIVSDHAEMTHSKGFFVSEGEAHFLQRSGVGRDHFVLILSIECLIALLIRSQHEQRLIDINLVGKSLFQVEFFILLIGQGVEKDGHDRR